MDGAQSDLVMRYKLETEFFHDHVRHTRDPEKGKDRNKKAKEEWSNCGELGKVKTIHKRLPHKLGCSRELLVMAILAKRPSLFVEFLGWFEDSETLYIAMEYLEEGDLTKHIGTPLPQETVRNISKQILEGLEVMHQQGIAHRDLKPANIFVVRMSPVWVKLGDFGISKRILAQDTTTLHTQVETQVYGAPEVLGLDSNSETSEYTNSVDIWSLGRVVYELLVGAKLFVSEGQVFRYYFGRFPFPKDKLKALSPPTDDIGISFLEAMLVIQPEDRPTASSALRHVWLVGVKGDNEDSGNDQDKTTHGRDEKTRSDNRGNKIAAHGRRKKRGSEEIPITQGGTEYTPRDVASGENVGLRRGSDPSTGGSTIGTSMIMSPGVASIEISPIQTALPKPQLMFHSIQETHSKSSKSPRKNYTLNIPQKFKRKRPKPPTFILDEVTSTIAHQWTYHTRQNGFESDNSLMPKDKVLRNRRIVKQNQRLDCI
ncbi:kinase-like domain-containing protein [Tuber indicum]|nr:kinase-like domain-containing protein [Tuber indicum]